MSTPPSRTPAAGAEAADRAPEDYDVLVETDAIGFYYLVVDRKLDGVRVDGDVGALEQLLDGFAPSPLPA